MDRIIVRKDTYFDSVFLMSVSAELGELEGLEKGHVVLATPANRQLLLAEGFDVGHELGPTDLVVALRAEGAGALEKAALRLDELLTTRVQEKAEAGAARPVGLEGALEALPGANVALISVPGEYAAYEARKALAAGLHVMLFSDNVSVEDEIALKEQALKDRLLLMGPDCGTAILGGVGLGFANAVRRGPVGLVGASGTGLQEVSCLLDRAGAGVSQALGTGGRDLSEAVGARTTLLAIDVLAADPETKVLVVISKPPAEAVAEKVLARLAEAGKPAVVHFVGQREAGRRGGVVFAPDLEATALAAAALATGREPAFEAPGLPAGLLDRERSGKAPEQRHLRALYTGGTLAAEALALLEPDLGEIPNNLHGEAAPGGHLVLDLGADEFTRGRPHPMIDPSPRIERLFLEGNDPTVSVILLDVVIGTGSHPDPAGAMVPALEEARQKAEARGGRLSVVASVTGTDADAQHRAAQVARLERAGAVVLPSNAQAVRLARALLVNGASHV